uniref:Uncharacterized protein n=1 Tax=Anopheles culicifacies TaxID=139723 RepID=A0A182MG45_9DIPT
MLLFVVFITCSVGFFGHTQCTPHREPFNKIEQFVQNIGPDYGVNYSGVKADLHRTLQRILEVLNSDRLKLISSKQSIEDFTENKLRQYEVTSVTDSVVDNLNKIFHKLDEANDAELKKQEQYQQEYMSKLEELSVVQEQVLAQRGTTVALSRSIQEQNVTLSKTLEMQQKLQKIITDQPLTSPQDAVNV